jgi:hypothetical protein
MILSMNRCVSDLVLLPTESESMIFERTQAVLAMQLSTVYAACVSKCMDLKASDGSPWKDKDAWTCQVYQDSAYKGICRGFASSTQCTTLDN